jgi:hypothetical protein
MGTENTRRFKIAWMENTIQAFFSKKPRGIISKERLLAEFSLANGSTERTGREILTLLEKTDRINIEEDDITKCS